MPVELVGGYSAFDQIKYAGNDPYALAQAPQAQQGQQSAPVDKQTLGAAVVTKTLDNMNSGGQGGGTNSDYDFQTKVLEGGLVAKGLVVNGKV